MKKTEWKRFRGTSYLVSEYGDIWSERSGAAIKPFQMPSGYFQVKIKGPGRQYVHRMVAESFWGPPPTAKHEVAHYDGNRGNNSAKNLRWATRKENHADKRRHGTHGEGEAHPQAKLTESDVLQIRERVKGGELQKDLAKEFGVSKITISRATRGENWGHIKESVVPKSAPWAGKFGSKHPLSRAVAGTPLGGGDVLYFESTREAGRSGFCSSAVSACCRGRLGQHKGYKWEYSDVRARGEEA